MKNILYSIISFGCIFTAMNLKAQDSDFSIKMSKHSAVLKSGTMTAKVHRNYPVVMFEIAGKPLRLAANTGYEPKEFKLCVDDPERKMLILQGKAVEKKGVITQFYCEYEIIKGLPLLFIRSRVYNRDNAGPAKCNFCWGFRNGLNYIESDDAKVLVGKPWSPLPHVKKWIYVDIAGSESGIGVIYRGLGEPGRFIFTNFSGRAWETNKKRAAWFISSNKNGKLGLFAEDKYNEINLVVFPAKNKSEAKKIFNELKLMKQGKN